MRVHVRNQYLMTLISILLAIALCCAPVLGASLEGDDIPKVTFHNVRSTSLNLFVKKKVQALYNDAPADADEEFFFHLVLNGKVQRSYPYYRQDASGKRIYVYADGTSTTERPGEAEVEVKTDANGTFSLKAGQTAVFEGIPVDAEYEITEDEVENYRQIVPSAGNAAEGVVSSEGAFVEFTNQYEPPRTDTPPDTEEPQNTVIHVKKEIVYPDGYETPPTTPFTFNLNVDGSAWALKAGYVVAKDGTVRDITTGTNGEFSIAPDEEAVFEEIPINVDYNVSEADADGWHLASSSGTRGATTTAPVFTTFTNAGASFGVRKSIQDDSPSSDSFKLYLVNSGGEAMPSVEYFLYGADKKLVQETPLQTGSDGSFELTANQTAIFFGIANGESYGVREDEKEGYQQVSPVARAGYTNQSVTDTVRILPFINAITEKGDLTIKKLVGDNTAGKNAKYRFTVSFVPGTVGLLDSYLCEIGGRTEYMKLTNNRYTFELSDQESLMIHGLPYGTQYTVEEADYSAAYEKQEINTKGTIDSAQKEATISNYKLSDLIVSKTVSGNMANRHKEFDFTVKIEEGTIASLPDEIAYTKGSTNGTIRVEDGAFHFKLAHGENIRFKDLPFGTKFKVDETVLASLGYRVSGENHSGTIPETDITSSFINTRNVGIPTSSDTAQKGALAIAVLAALGVGLLIWKRGRVV